MERCLEGFFVGFSKYMCSLSDALKYDSVRVKLHLKVELNDREEAGISSSWIEKKVLTLLQYSLYSREKPSKSNPCPKHPYTDSWLMAHIALKSDLKRSQVKARKREDLLNYEK